MTPSNTSDQLVNSTQFALSNVCSLLGNLAWKQEYLTNRTFIILVVILCVEVLLSVPTISINVLVIWAVKVKLYLRKQNTCTLLACLAVTDLLVGAVVLPLAIASHLERLVGSGPTCLMELTAGILLYVAFVASLFHLAIISSERYVAIKHCLRYKTLVTPSRLLAAVASAWASTVISLAAILRFLEHYVSFVVLSVAIIGLIAVIAFCQVAVLFESQRHRRHIRDHQVSEAAAKEILKQNKAARTTSMIISALCLCYVPQLIYTVIFMEESYPRPETLCTMYVMDLLLYFNSLINPIIYSIRTREFKRAFREIVNCTNSQVSSGLRMQPVADPTAQRTTRRGWLVLTRLRDSRIHSLDLPSDSSHQQRPGGNSSV